MPVLRVPVMFERIPLVHMPPHQVVNRPRRRINIYTIIIIVLSIFFIIQDLITDLLFSFGIGATLPEGIYLSYLVIREIISVSTVIMLETLLMKHALKFL